jgi:hypothetical protein
MKVGVGFTVYFRKCAAFRAARVGELRFSRGFPCGFESLIAHFVALSVCDNDHHGPRFLEGACASCELPDWGYHSLGQKCGSPFCSAPHVIEPPFLPHPEDTLAPETRTGRSTGPPSSARGRLHMRFVAALLRPGRPSLLKHPQKHVESPRRIRI